MEQQQTTRQIYQVQKTGKYDGMKQISDQLSPPEEGQIQIEVKAIGLNFADIFALMGLYSATPKTPFIPGLEFAGTIKSLGKNIQRDYKVGDKVYGVTRFGGYTSHLNIGYQYTQPLPEGWSFQEGAAFMCQTATAYYGLIELGNLKKRHSVLIHSGAGGVGLQANRICKAIGAYTIGTVGTESKVKVLQDEKYDECIYRDKNWHEKVQRKPDIVMDAIGNDVLRKSYDMMNKMGRLVTFGGADFTPKKDLSYFSLAIPYLSRPKYDPLEMVSQNKSIMAFNLIWLWEQQELFDEMLQNIQALNLPKPMVGKEFSFKQLPEAMQYLQSGKSVGKVVVNVDI